MRVLTHMSRATFGTVLLASGMVILVGLFLFLPSVFSLTAKGLLVDLRQANEEMRQFQAPLAKLDVRAIRDLVDSTQSRLAEQNQTLSLLKPALSSLEQVLRMTSETANGLATRITEFNGVLNNAEKALASATSGEGSSLLASLQATAQQIEKAEVVPAEALTQLASLRNAIQAVRDAERKDSFFGVNDGGFTWNRTEPGSISGDHSPHWLSYAQFSAWRNLITSDAIGARAATDTRPKRALDQLVDGTHPRIAADAAAFESLLERLRPFREMKLPVAAGLNAKDFSGVEEAVNNALKRTAGVLDQGKVKTAIEAIASGVGIDSPLLGSVKDELSKVATSLQKVPDAVEIIQASSEKMHATALGGTAPTALVLMAIAGMLVTVGVTSLIHSYRLTERDADERRWRDRVDLYRQLAVELSAKGISPDLILEKLNAMRPSDFKEASSLQTPVSQIVREIARGVKGSK